MKSFYKMVLDKKLTVQIERFDEGIQVSLTGGDRSHIGAVSIYVPEGPVQSWQRLGHQEGELSRLWAIKLGECLHVPVCVVCGIHYDHLDAAGIKLILKECQQWLKQLCMILKQEAD